MSQSSYRSSDSSSPPGYERRRYVAFVYMGGLISLVILVACGILRQVYSSLDESLISEGVDATTFEVLTLLSSSIFGAAVVGVIIDQYQRRVSAREARDAHLVSKEGFADVFKSASDPRLIEYLNSQIASANSEIAAFGLGLGILSHNIDLLESIADRLNNNRGLIVRIMSGTKGNKGVQSRISEETDWHKQAGANYDPTWVTRYPAEIESVFARDVKPEARDRLEIVELQLCPMLTVLRIDTCYVIHMYGTPSIRGSRSPWLALERSSVRGSLIKFLDAILDSEEVRKKEPINDE